MAETGGDIAIPRRFLRKRPRTGRGERIYAIGDIHGRIDLFLRLLQALEADGRARPLGERQAKIIVLGDFIDRGPWSRPLVEALWRMRDESGLTVLLGNHEASLLACADGVDDPRDGWLDFGGRETLQSFGIAEPAVAESTADFAARLAGAIGEPVLGWLRTLPLFVISGDYLFVHAGLRPGVPLARQSSTDLLWIRDEFLSSGRAHSHVVIHGHSEADTIDIRANRVGIDTGAWRTGRLTALALEHERAWTIIIEDG